MNTCVCVCVYMRAWCTSSWSGGTLESQNCNMVLKWRCSDKASVEVMSEGVLCGPSSRVWPLVHTPSVDGQAGSSHGTGVFWLC